ncbi:aminopeptidase P family protein [Paenibacillus sp. TRM 82003]|uniref:aminopeptidase P family protein n=1 Tax=Kineococcus sp. TRM81007 TaxID=2925831 RepID=UPI001F573FD4|nr:aminopeptidase P family protein [Kineococcus sp. TRM81007]MCI2239565.1 aminopeptidase P family protein [Kineococcus sp. TRM81007]MCI3926153.1 aminopeptidase P family protein [Paenibacillus sp. TRM 82003]
MNPLGERTRADLPPYARTRPPRLAEASDGFLAGIAHGWGERVVPAPVEPAAARAAAEHRGRLSALFPGRTLVIASGHAAPRNGDADHPFRAHSDFVWATSCQLEGGVLVMHARPGGHDAVLHVPAPARPGERDFHASAAHGELWVGPSAGLPEWSAALDLPVLDVSGLTLPPGALTAGAPLRGAGTPVAGSGELPRALSDLRRVKDEWEVQQLRVAVDRTVEGFAAVAREVPLAVRDGLGERWLQGTFDRYARTFGNGPGYSTIVGSGPHAPVLHWVRCDGDVLPGQPLLLDMGVETTTLYTADVTRTIPVGGGFTPAQRAVHDLVEAAHRAGMDRVRPGAWFSDFHFASMEVLARGLHDWGLLPVSVDEALSPAGQQHRRYIVCGVGHHLGLDVHDCGASEYEEYHGAPLEPGMVLTVEPGLYFHAHDETVPPELRGIGVRLEDDLLVTADGQEVLSGALPVDAAGLEEWARSAAG